MLASMNAEGMGPCLAVEGSTRREVFEAYLERVLAPSLRSGQVIVMDNDGLGEVLADSRLLLVAPGLSAQSRGALTGVVISPATKIPVLELLPANGGEVVGIQGVGVAPWPCSVEELQRRIEVALLA